MWRQWTIALLWLIFIKLQHFLIMHNSTWPISWMLWYQWTGIIVWVYVGILCVQKCGSHPDLKITSKYGAFQREPRRKGLAQICIKEPTLKNKRQEQEGNIFSCVASVSIGRPLLVVFLLSKLLLQGIWTNSVPSRGEHGEEKHWSEILPGVRVTSCSSVPVRSHPPPFRKLHKHHLSQHRVVYSIMWRLCGAAAHTFVLLTKINNFLFWQWVTFGSLRSS